MKNKTLDTLFKNTFSTSPASEEDEWDALHVRLQKKLFFRFSWNRFNIYYVVLLGVCVLINVLFLITHFARPSSDTSGLSAKMDTTIHTRSLILPEQPGKTTNGASASNATTPYKKETLPLHSYTDSSGAGMNSATDSIPIRKTGDDVRIVSETPKQQVVLKREKKLYISRRDTIVTIDTLTIKKGKKNNF